MPYRQCEECCFDSEEDLKPVEVGDDDLSLNQCLEGGLGDGAIIGNR